MKSYSARLNLSSLTPSLPLFFYFLFQATSLYGQYGCVHHFVLDVLILLANFTLEGL